MSSVPPPGLSVTGLLAKSLVVRRRVPASKRRLPVPSSVAALTVPPPEMWSEPVPKLPTARRPVMFQAESGPATVTVPVPEDWLPR